MSDSHLPGDEHIRDEEERLRRLTSAIRQQPGSSDPYWQNLLVRTNQKIDEVSGVRALSISWALRVAIPGVVAIVFFLFGLHYYAPQRTEKETSIEAVVLSLPREAQDSLLTTLSVEDRISAAASNDRLFEPTQEQIAEYMLDNGSTEVLVQTLTDSQFDELLNGLGGSPN
jgi:hypothetical protein